MIIRKEEGAFSPITPFTGQKRAIMSHQPAGRPVIGIKSMPRLDIFSMAEYASAPKHTICCYSIINITKNTP